MAGLGGLLCALALAIGAGPAVGDGGARTQIKVTKIDHSGAKGVVNSGQASCVGGRTVQFFRIENYVSVKVKITKTDGQGQWRVKKSLKDGKYFAKVDSSPGCRYDVSKNEYVR